jgi:hypothetical protein
MNPAAARQPILWLSRKEKRREGKEERTISFVIHIVLFLIFIVDFDLEVQESIGLVSSSPLYHQLSSTQSRSQLTFLRLSILVSWFE